MLVSTLFGRYLEDTLQFRSYYSYFSPMALKKYATSFMKKDSLHWIGDSTVYPHPVSRSINTDLALFHYLKQGSLCLGRSRQSIWY